MLNTFLFAMRFLWRESRAGEWFIIFFALILAVSATTGLHFYTDRLMRGLEQQSAKFLGGDIAVNSSTPIPAEWVEKAKALQLRTAMVLSYPSVASSGSHLQLINLQAVSDEYPLLDQTNKHPQALEAWVEPRLLFLLSAELAGNIKIGVQNFRISQALTSETDTLNTGWLVAPRVLIRLQDVPLTKTVLPGSRIDYRLLLVGNKTSLQAFRQWLIPRLVAGQRLIDVRSQQSIIHTTLDRVDNYLQLVLLVCLMMSGVAIAISVQQYLQRHTKYVALWRTLGARKNQIIQIFIWQLVLIALFAAGMGIAIGYLFQAVFADLFKNYLQFRLPNVSLQPALLGFSVCVFLLFAFAYPMISSLPRVSPLSIWQEKITDNLIKKNFYLIISLILLVIFLFIFTDYSLLTLLFLDIILLSIGFLYGLILLLLSGIRFLAHFTEGAVTRGLSQLISYPDSISLQFIGFTLVLTFIIVLGFIRSDLIQKWQATLPTTTPNYFVINIAPTDIAPLKALFKKNNLTLSHFYPQVRGRLIALNNKPILTAVPEGASGHNALHRELNLSWMNELPTDNKIIKGHMWSATSNDRNLISVENNLATDLNLKLGDELTFQTGSDTYTAKIANFRSVDWQSFHPNFFVIFTPGSIERFPTTYMTSFYLTPKETLILNVLIQQFPNLTIIDVANLLDQVRELIHKISVALQYLFVFALLAGILIFITSFKASLAERTQVYRLLRILGASNRYIIKSAVVEFGVLLLLILASACMFALIITQILIYYIFP